MLSNLMKSVSVGSLDIIVLVGLCVVFFAYALYAGKSRVVALILAFYPAQFFYSIFPFMERLMFLKGETLEVANKMLVFALFLVPIWIVINRYIFSDSGYGSEKIFRTAGLALAGVIVVLIFSYSVVDLGVFYNFGPAVDGVFAGGNIFYWNIVPLALLFFL